MDGSYAAQLEFDDGTAASLLFDAYGHFDSAELTYGIGLGGRERTKETNVGAHRRAKGFARPEDEWAYKESVRYGGSRSRREAETPTRHQMFGLTIVDCEKGAMRLTPEGIMVYGEDEWREIRFPAAQYPQTELDIFYKAWASGEPLQYHDGPWGRATTEVCLGILQSGRERRELPMERQVALPRAR